MISDNDIKFNQYEIGFQNEGSHKIDKMEPISKYDTATALKVYNTVIDIVKTKLSPHILKGDRIYFNAVSHRTLKIYQRFAKMIAKEIRGEVLTGKNPSQFDFFVVKR